MYTNLGYSVYRTVLEYYLGETENENALDMRVISCSQSLKKYIFNILLLNFF